MEKNIQINLSEKNLIYLAFIEGFLVMGLEILSINFINPYFGNHNYVVSIILAVTLSALALGYFISTKLNQNKNRQKSLYFVTALSIFFILVSPFFNVYFLRNSTYKSLEFDLILITFFTLFLPLLFLSIISPLIIYFLNNDKNVGLVSGRVYFYTTIAGVISTFVVVFLLIDIFKSYQIIFIFGFLFFIYFYFVFVRLFSGLIKNLTLILFSVLFLFIFLKAEKILEEPIPDFHKILYKSEGVLGEIKVEENHQTKMRYLYVNNTVQTFTGLDGMSLWEYVHRSRLIVNSLKKKSDILMAGLGGGSLAEEFAKTNHYVDIVELDSRMPKVANEFFNLKNYPNNINYIIDDARHFIEVNIKKYDFIILDLSLGENVPSNVYTLEAFKKMSKQIKDDGLILLHFFNSKDRDGIQALHSISKTLKVAGLKLKKVDMPFSKNSSSTLFIAGYKLPDSDALLENTKLIEFKDSIGFVLTDDKPILEKLMQNHSKNVKEEIIKNYKNNWKIIYEKYI